MDRFLIYNGKIVEKEEPTLLHFFNSETIKITRKIWYGYGGIPLLNENIDLLTMQVEMLRLPVPAFLKDKRELFRITKRMLNKNRLYRSGFVYFQIFWNNNGYNFLVTSHPANTFDFPISDRGILLNYSAVLKHSGNEFNHFPVFNESMWQAAIAQNRDTLFQNAILLNEKNAICECVSANIYMIQKNEVLTPAMSSGCFEDTIRPIIIELMKDLGFNITESRNLMHDNVIQSDELFIASEETGIQWILGVENKRFVHEHSVVIHKKLNEFLKEKVN